MSQLEMITCPCCGVASEAPEGDLEFLKKNIVRCTSCNAELVPGGFVPVIVPEPLHIISNGVSVPRVRLRFQHPVTREDIYSFHVDPKLGAAIARNILSVVVG